MRRLPAVALASAIACLPLPVTGIAAAAARAPRALDFDSEVVRIAIVGDSVEVRGLYRFLCAGAGDAVPLLYPYPVDTRLGGARTVSLEGRAARSATWNAIPFAEVAAPGSIWELPVCRDTLEVRTVYRQALRARYARYIVTTTGSWGRPLAHARFEITLAPGARPLRFSHPFRQPAGRRRTWVFEATDFLPDRDIEVEWR